MTPFILCASTLHPKLTHRCGWRLINRGTYSCLSGNLGIEVVVELVGSVKLVGSARLVGSVRSVRSVRSVGSVRLVRTA
jgi:hypothetical protein